MKQESVDLVNILGCAYFSYSILIQKSTYGKLVAEELLYPELPTSLNTIGGLNFNQRLHVENDYLLFTNFPFMRSTAFTLSTQSLIRVRATGVSDDQLLVVSLSNSNDDSNSLIEANTTILYQANAGSYILTFRYENYFSFDPVIANIEIAIVPVTALQTEITTRYILFDFFLLNHH